MNNRTAFPASNDVSEAYCGLTKLEYIAIKFYASRLTKGFPPEKYEVAFALAAIRNAKALLAELEKEQK